jgi:hypothetical protein
MIMNRILVMELLGKAVVGSSTVDRVERTLGEAESSITSTVVAVRISNNAGKSVIVHSGWRGWDSAGSGQTVSRSAA